MSTGDIGLAHIEIVSGCTADAKPFCTISARMEDGTTHFGQLSPDEVRIMALAWLEAAEAATSDALIVLGLRDVGVDDEVLAKFLMQQRWNRERVSKLARGD